MIDKNQNDNKRKCLFCGKIIKDDQTLCDDCRDSSENQYQTDFLNNDDTEDLENKGIREDSFIDEIRKKKKSKSVFYFILFCAFVTIFGIVASVNNIQLRHTDVAEDNYWKRCLETNSELSYAQYLVAYPEGKYINVANDNIEKLKNNEFLKWIKIKNSSNINDILQFIDDNNNSIYIDSANILVDSLSWVNVLNIGTKDALLTYISSTNSGLLKGIYIKEANEKYDYISTLDTLKSGSLDSLKIFVEDFYKSINKQDTLLSNNFLTSLVYFNGTSIQNTEFLTFLLDRQINKDSIILYSPEIESLNAIRDRFGVYFLDYIEIKTTQKKHLKGRKNKKNSVIEQPYVTKDSVSLKIDNSNRIFSFDIS